MQVAAGGSNGGADGATIADTADDGAEGAAHGGNAHDAEDGTADGGHAEQAARGLATVLDGAANGDDALEAHPATALADAATTAWQPVFVGRSAQLAILATELQRAASGDPRAVWIGGPLGMGKTQLVRRFLAGAPPHRLIWASADEGETVVPYGIATQLLEALGAESPPTSTPNGQPAESAGQPHPLSIGSAMLAALGSARGPLVVVVDDIQWMDLESARTLLFVMRRLRTEPMLAVFTSEADPPARLGAGWRRLLTDPARVTPLPLGGLEPPELAELATVLGHRGLSPMLARRLHEHTDGHPLHSRSFLAQEGVLPLRHHLHVLPAPRTLVILTAARIAALAQPARDLLAAGAILGHSFRPELASSLAGVAHHGEALDAAGAAGLIAVRPGHVTFAHPLVHASVYHGLPPARRRDLHHKAAAMTAGPERLHHRVAAATGFDPELAAELVAHAREAVAAGEYVRAAERLEAAGRFVADPALRETVLLESVALLYLSGEHSLAEGHRAEVLACADGPQRTFVLGLIAFAAGRLAEAARLFDEVLDGGAEQMPPHRRARAAVSLAFVLLECGEWDGAIAAARSAIAIDGAPWERCVALSAAVLALAELGRSAEGAALVHSFSPQPVEGAGAVDLLAAVGMATMLQDNDELTRAVDDLQAVARRVRLGEPARLPELALANLAQAEYRLGRWDDAAFHADLAIAAAADAPRDTALLRARTVAAWISGGQGRFEDAEAHLRQAELLSAATESWFGRRLLAMARAVVAEARDDTDSVIDAVRCGLARPVDAEAAVGTTGWRMLVVSALVQAGPGADAQAAVTAFEQWVESGQRTAFRDDAVRLRGLLAEACDDPGAGVIYAAGVERRAGVLSTTLARGRLHAAYGRFLGEQGRQREAIEQLRAARLIFAKLRAAPFVDRCDVQLATCGLPTRAPDRGPLELTDAETRVARLVAAGNSNRDAASQLFVSTKTVEYHLGHIFAKLGISSRLQLARVLDGSG